MAKYDIIGLFPCLTSIKYLGFTYKYLIFLYDGKFVEVMRIIAKCWISQITVIHRKEFQFGRLVNSIVVSFK